MKLVVLDGYTENPGDLSWDGLGQLGELTVYDRTDVHNEEEIVERMAGAQVVFTNKTPLSADALARSPELKMIGVLATGYNVVDCQAARERGIPVCNVPAYGTASVAQFAIALLLEICSRVGHHDQAVHQGRWSGSADFCFWEYPLIELAGKTMGIVGFGRIGQQTARIAQALGMKILACTKVGRDKGSPVPPELGEDVTLDRLLAESDVVSLHCPLTPATQGLICQETIGKMKDGAILINNGRGQLVVEQDLAQALNSGKLYAAGLDVAAQEPIPADSPLLTAKNCVITPHISWAPRESRQRIMDCTVENLRQFLSGTPQNVVNGL